MIRSLIKAQILCHFSITPIKRLTYDNACYIWSQWRTSFNSSAFDWIANRNITSSVVDAYSIWNGTSYIVILTWSQVTTRYDSISAHSGSRHWHKQAVTITVCWTGCRFRFAFLWWAASTGLLAICRILTCNEFYNKTKRMLHVKFWKISHFRKEIHSIRVLEGNRKKWSVLVLDENSVFFCYL